MPPKISYRYVYVSVEDPEHLDSNQPPKQVLDVLVQNLIAKQITHGILTVRQVAFSKSDIRIHDAGSQTATSIGDVYNSLLQEIMTLRRLESGLDRGNGHVTTSDSMWGPKADDCSYLLYVWFHPGLGMDMCWTVCNPRTRILAAEL
ncbi:hypothetical protein BDV40DRAFT_295183 [Aspergillus tamarii]|uniref:Uncharacterized protein n=1 Tax=Aspergillus tamarii TaxID=41984 RepID=A0A5N6VAM1_ASPTM|nr:hypothetical protein BDV40DRAFT_295183 [Aspergillus tamarii]